MIAELFFLIVHLQKNENNNHSLTSTKNLEKNIILLQF
jgi:hypothetical protein